MSFTCSAKSLVTEVINSLALIPVLLGIVHTGGEPLFRANTGTIHVQGSFQPIPVPKAQPLRESGSKSEKLHTKVSQTYPSPCPE